MPIYEYQCADCGKSTEALRKMDQADDPIACAHCGGKKTRRQQSVFAAAASSHSSGSLPMSPCGRCGDPRGSCGMN